MNELFSIAGKVAVITGAGGVLGGNIAQHFVQQGAKVVAIDIRQEQLDNRVAELKQYGNDVIGIIGNVLDIASLEKVAEEVVAKWGQIDILLNIAGGNMPGATLEPDQHFYDMDISCWEKVTNLNMNGTVYPSMIFGKVMAKQKKGCIINVSSMAAYSAITRVPGYSAAKTAVANFTQWLASEMALKYGDGIRVNAIAPGFFMGTDITDVGYHLRRYSTHCPCQQHYRAGYGIGICGTGAGDRYTQYHSFTGRHRADYQSCFRLETGTGRRSRHGIDARYQERALQQ